MRFLKNIIEINGLCKSFGEIKAVNDLSFSVGEGQLFAFLGVNGAGKSTTISMICSLLKKDSGSIVIDGISTDENSDKIKSKLGVVFQNSVLDKQLSVRDNLLSRAALYGICGEDFEKRLSQLSRLLDLSGLLKRKLGKLSGGQLRRIDIARALLNNPEILILDEPTTGLDPQTRKQIWNVIYKLRRENGLTVLLTTHYMEEAAEADNVVIIDGGRKVAEGSPIELKNKYTGDFITLYGASEADVTGLGESTEAVPGGVRIKVKNTEEAAALIIKHPALFKDFEIVKGKMDDVFLSVTGKKGEGEENK